MKKAFENIVGKGENAGNRHFLLFPQWFLLYQGKKTCLQTSDLLSANALNLVKSKNLSYDRVNPLPDMPISGSSNSAANKDMMSKILTNGDTIS